MERAPAIKVPIQAVLHASLAKDEDTPNALELGSQKAIRVNLMGVVVEQEPKGFLLDDGTGKISVRSFDEPKHTEIGWCVQVIGKPREYNGERYVVPEIVTQTTEVWLRVRKKELEGFSLPEKEEEEKPEPLVEGENIHEKLLRYLREKDEGTGVAIEQALTDLRIQEDAITRLLLEGEAFENQPGRIKLLE